ncbi:peptidase C39 [Halieaceae bacterium IMCC14734]|uniref:Peptidase C39 n=1 Tax=Candidatus Litorirhabdus singularis TaxID=2518993 RepID=A0ABT3TC40_9GAMM|nr:C39 family peptidase [Candidatus Litorirhabdus singularis]MCX2979400.1 peptidase C39 [Candidatus Litorirhabdus singularis]
MKRFIWGFLLAILAPAQGMAWLDGQGAIRGSLPLQDWRSLRDRGVHKQDFDYSCGAASLATLLQGYFGIETSEQALLQRLPLHQGRTSFADLATLVRVDYGLQAAGYALSFAQLQQLARPVLLYLSVRGQDHFSVLRGIDANGAVWLADPSWGNRLLTRTQFEAIWYTRAAASHPGKILLLEPSTGGFTTRSDYYQSSRLAQEIRRADCQFCRAGG